MQSVCVCEFEKETEDALQLCWLLGMAGLCGSFCSGVVGCVICIV